MTVLMGGHYVGEPVNTVEEFIDWTNQRGGESFVYRGMPNATWKVESSAYRRIGQSQKTPPPLPVLRSYIERLLQNARARRFQEHEGKGLTNLELLAELQHYGAATCLIDFTSNALIALWFACRDEGRQVPGRVVAMADTPDRFSPVDPNHFSEDSVNFLSEDKLWKWKPIHPSIRIVTQQSVFVFGPGKIDEKDYESVEINGLSKGKIREELARRFDIVEQHLFRDFTGFATSHAHDSPYSGYTADDYFSLGSTAQQQRFYGEAEEFYGRALELDPHHTDARKNRETVEKSIAEFKARPEAGQEAMDQLWAQVEAGDKAKKKLKPLIRRVRTKAKGENEADVEALNQVLVQVRNGREAFRKIKEIAAMEWTVLGVVPPLLSGLSARHWRKVNTPDSLKDSLQDLPDPPA